MSNSDPSIGNEPSATSNGSPSPGQEATLAELTRCLSDAYTARGRIRMERGELGLARADLDDAIRQDPGNAEAHDLLALVQDPQGRRPQAEAESDQAERLDPVNLAGSPTQTRFQAGYQVEARYPYLPGGDGDPLASPSPLTVEGRLQAIEFARRMCRDESRSQRGELYDASWTDGEEFDTVVVEFRSLTREVHVERALDEDGHPIEW